MFPHQRSRKTTIRFPWHLLNHIFFLYIYDNILPIFPGDPDLHFPCMLSPYPKTVVARCERRTGVRHQQAPRASVMSHLYYCSQTYCKHFRDRMRPQWHLLQQMAAGMIGMCSTVSTCATSEIRTDNTLLKIFYFQHWPLLDLL